VITEIVLFADNTFLTTKEAAEKLNVSLRNVQQMITAGTLPAKKVGRDYVILERDLETVKT
jgi:excisionase family DNA binding protein